MDASLHKLLASHTCTTIKNGDVNSRSPSSAVEVSVSLSYRAHASVRGRLLELDDYVIRVTADIVGTDVEAGTEAESEVALGHITFYLIRVANACNDGVRLCDVFDVYQETMDAGSAIYDSSFSDLKPAVQKLFVDAHPWDDVLLLHRLEIHPFARGQKLGLAVLARVIEDWSSGCSLVLMKPSPLQFEADARESARWRSPNLDSLPQEKQRAVRKLRSYYEKLGFKRIGNSEFYSLGRHEEWTALDELAFPDGFFVPSQVFAENNKTA